MSRMVIRRGGAEDIEPAVAVWLAANTVRREGLTPRSEQAARARGHVSNPEALLLIAQSRSAFRRFPRLLLLPQSRSRRILQGAPPALEAVD